MPPRTYAQNDPATIPGFDRIQTEVTDSSGKKSIVTAESFLGPDSLQEQAPKNNIEISPNQGPSIGPS